MKKILFLIKCSFIIWVLLLNPAISSVKWKLIKYSSGIKVYTREAADSDIDEFMGTAIIRADLSVIEAVIGDIPAQTKWMHNCIESRLIKMKSENVRIIYNVTDAPWPVNDRDAVVRTEVNRDPQKGQSIISIRSINYPGISVKNGRFRMPKLTGNWRFYYLGPGRTKCVYRIRANPGGSIPVWLANRTARDVPYETLSGLKRMVQKQKYIDEGARIRRVDGDIFKKYYDLRKKEAEK